MFSPQLFENLHTAAEKYGKIRAKLEKAGTPIGPNDLFIAAIAASNDKTLVTNKCQRGHQRGQVCC